MQEIECLKDELGKSFCFSCSENDIAAAKKKKNHLKHVNHIPQLQDPKSQEGLKTQQIA